MCVNIVREPLNKSTIGIRPLEAANCFVAPQGRFLGTSLTLPSALPRECGRFPSGRKNWKKSRFPAFRVLATVSGVAKSAYFWCPASSICGVVVSDSLRNLSGRSRFIQRLLKKYWTYRWLKGSSRAAAQRDRETFIPTAGTSQFTRPLPGYAEITGNILTVSLVCIRPQTRHCKSPMRWYRSFQ